MVVTLEFTILNDSVTITLFFSFFSCSSTDSPLHINSFRTILSERLTPKCSFSYYMLHMAPFSPLLLWTSSFFMRD